MDGLPVGDDTSMYYSNALQLPGDASPPLHVLSPLRRHVFATLPSRAPQSSPLACSSQRLHAASSPHVASRQTWPRPYSQHGPEAQSLPPSQRSAQEPHSLHHHRPPTP